VQSVYLNIARWAAYFAVYYTFLLTLVGHLTASELSTPTLIMATAALVAGPLGFVRLRRSDVWKAAGTFFSQERGDLWDVADLRRLRLGVALLAGTGLFLELGVIRWHSSTIPMFAFYKNFSLLACFAGLGFGYAMSSVRGNFLVHTLWLLVLQIGCLLILRYGAGDAVTYLMSSPIGEQTNMGVRSIRLDGFGAAFLAALLPVYGLLIAVFTTTVAMFIPIGHATGRIMDRLPRLQAYGMNLAGSIAGVVAFTLISFLWAPPVTWFIPAAVIFVLLVGDDRSERVATVVAMAVLVGLISWPTDPTSHRIYSPYQLIERTMEPSTGLMRILSGGTYFQKVYDFSENNLNRDAPAFASVRQYYDLPYTLADSLDKVVIVGAGSGNDAAAALRAGAKHVDAVEIDPAIIALGREYHPERPYSDPRVRPIVNDARTFFRTSGEQYDAVVYGVLDSHTQLSQGTSVRIDSFVYTLEGFREGYARLKDGGIFYVSFALLSESQGGRILAMMKELSGGDPLVVHVAYDAPTTAAFILRKGGSIDAWRARVTAMGFDDVTAMYVAHSTGVDIPTDDWPFFYMVKRVYPVSYLPALGIILMLTLMTGRRLIFGSQFRASSMVFFFLGSAFMLLETKAITELGLLFGNTWMVVAVVIVAILTMAFFANLAVERRQFRSVAPLYAVLLTATLLAYASYGVTFTGNYALQKLLSVVILTIPLLFSGMVFSTELARSDVDVSQALGYNILGALFGGLLEYNSMYFGFSFLFLLAAGMYLAAMVVSHLPKAVWVPSRQRA
jgi:hypothetical protein